MTNDELKNFLELTIKNIQYEHFDEWVQNFALNLNGIWNESSAKELTPSLEDNLDICKTSAIVIGRGPAINKYQHLKALANSNFKGSIVCCDGKLIDALNSGVTPEKFPKFYVVTIDPYSDIMKHYDDPIVDEYGSKIKGIFTTITNPLVVNRARKAGIKIHWLHSLFDYNEGKKSFNQISATMVRTKKHLKGLPAIQTGGNVGTSSWFISWKILGCSNIGLIGINHGWEEDDSWETILSHGKNYEISEELKKYNSGPNNIFKKIYNPDFNCNCIMDPLFQFYSSALKEFISRSPNWVNTINSTEGGSIFGERIKSMKFSEFLEKYQT